MRLLNATNFELRDFLQGDIPPYAILSHTWGDSQEEVLFQDMADLEKARMKPGFQKIDGCCRQARQFDWVWVDSCCIDKSSSAELSEAINSMFQWYKDSHICYAYLSDVVSSPALVWKSRPSSDFEYSRWFSRGWTLQELIAPDVLHFFNRDWENIATRASFASILEKITGIPDRVFHGEDITKHCVLEKMSWARTRKTTRIEDIAYSLLGLFDINMPLLYGEGTRAFTRLQEEILKTSGDYSLFAWEDDQNIVENIFASSPSQFGKVFKDSGGYVLATTGERPVAAPVSIWGSTVKLEMSLGLGDENGFAPAYLHCCIKNQLVCIMVARGIGDTDHIWRRRGQRTLISHSSLSEFSPQLLSFKIMASSTPQSIYNDRYTTFAISKLPPCMQLQLSKRPNAQPMTKNTGDGIILAFVHDTADQNDCTSIQILHGPHENEHVVQKRPEVDYTDLKNYLKSLNKKDEAQEIVENTKECERLDLAFSLIGLYSRAAGCVVTRMRIDGTVLQRSELSDQYCSLTENKDLTSGHFLTVSVKPSSVAGFRVAIVCCEVNGRDLVDPRANLSGHYRPSLAQ
jgi:hypothetical protein